MDNENIIKTPFRSYALEEEKQTKFEVVSVKFNLEDYAELQQLKKLIEQPKDATAIKTLMKLGAQVVLEPKTKLILDTLTNNRRNNKRSGLTEF